MSEPNELTESHDLKELRALRADAPLPDTDRLAPQRALLAEEFRSGAERRRPAFARGGPPRRRMFLAAAGAVTALAVTGGAVVLLSDDTPGTDTAVPSGRRLLSARGSAEALELAAATVEKLGATEPGPKQWVYEKSTSFGQQAPQTTEVWTRWDGTGWARLPGIPPAGRIDHFDRNKLQVTYGPNQEEKWKKEGYDDRSQRQFYRFLATLPSDPGRMMRRIREEHAIGDIKGETPAQRDWREIHVLYRSVLIPPKVQAGMFRALARIPGARVEKGIKDPVGRPAIGVTVTYDKPTASGYQGKQEIFFDTATYAYLGASADLPGEQGIHGSSPDPRNASPAARNARPAIGNGSPAIITVRNAWGVVDKPGARP
ncbi:CU044_5270 family protein [Streptomyces sp. NPDC059445]|uniref:CU044_5270 family protein n=1 Tax=Streptomyces sp. NPDC059445 TaxID=3346832 RepID=UPI003697CF20